MKQILYVLLVMPMGLFAQKFTLNGDVGKTSSQSMAYLNYSAGGKFQRDSCTVKGGKFTFNGVISERSSASLGIKAKGSGKYTTQMIQLYIEPGNIQVVSTDSLSKARVEGTPANDEYQQLRTTLLSSISRNEKSSAYKRFIGSHGKSSVALDALHTFNGPFPDVKVSDSLFKLLAPDVQNTAKGKIMAAMLAKLGKLQIGAMAPEFAQPDTSGKIIQLKDFRGKYVLIDFWASWCVPCRAENPTLVNAFAQFGGKNFTILGISVDKENAKKAWLEAIKKDGLKWTQVSDLQSFENAAAQLYAVHAIPQNYLVDPNGKIVAKNLRGEQLIETLKALKL